MVVDIKSIFQFLRSPKYSELALDVVQRTSKRLCDDLYDAELVHCQKALDAAGLALASIEALLNQDSDRIRKFSVALIRAENAIDLGQDFNPLEEPEDESSNETYVGHSLTFILTFSILYILIRDDRGRLAQYLKKMRQPKASKYQKAVETIFDNV